MTMLIDSEKIIPITKLQKQLTQKVREISANDDILYIMKNNNMEAVLLSYNDYCHLKDIEELVEHFEISELVKKRLKKYNPGYNVNWNDLKEQ
jgi:PHD/YefM family antitoxin component YafN of YafNO toxin-antitoxin module